jgi:hypothetical protein
MPLASARRLLIALAVMTLAALMVAAPVRVLASATRERVPNLVKGTAYLVAPAQLITGRYYQSAPRFADFGLTIDGALALAATGDDNKALKEITGFIDDQGKDASGRTVNSWTGIGTRFAASGAIGKEALLAEVVGDNPRHFGGHDLLAALDAAVCRRASASASGSCAGRGDYANATSVFDQALAIIAMVRAGQRAQVAEPVAFLERLRNADGSFPSLIPDSHDQDVDSTAMAVMALALVNSQVARADVTSGVAWIASRQVPSGGFRGVGGLSLNSAGLAVQALSLRAARYRPRIRSALAFLASQQNPDGGFNTYAGQPGSNVRASTQAVGGATGISFGTLSRDLRRPAVRRTSATVSGWGQAARFIVIVAVLAGIAAVVMRSRRVTT